MRARKNLEKVKKTRNLTGAGFSLRKGQVKCMDYLAVANSPVMWIACAIPVALVILQSVIFNILVLLIGTIFGVAVLSNLPDSVSSGLNYLLPALFGALWIMLAKDRLLMGVIGLALGIGLNLLSTTGVLPFYLVTILSVFGTIGIGIALNKTGVNIFGKG